MKLLTHLYCAWRWWRLGVSPRKAWQLSYHHIRKSSYRLEIALVIGLLTAYAVAAYNDADIAQRIASRATQQQYLAERIAVDLLNGHAMMVDPRSWAQCYVTETM